jgi:hypothetical protein
MHRQRVYGLSLETEQPFPELAFHGVSGPAEARPGHPDEAPPADVTIRWAHDGAAGQAAGESFAEWRSPTVIQSCFQAIGRFTVSAGRDILVEPEHGVDPGAVRHMLLGPVMAQVLWQRGRFALHSCVLQVGQRQFAFVGDSGEGKSTLAIALHRAGHTLLCDDTAALEWQLNPVLVHPAIPHLRAHEDTLANLGENADGLQRVTKEMSKWLLPARKFGSGPLPLDRVYVLTSGDDFAVEPLGRAEAMMELLRHTYYAEQFAGLFGVAQQMRMAGTLAMHLPVVRLKRPKVWERLPELVRFIEACAES